MAKLRRFHAWRSTPNLPDDVGLSGRSNSIEAIRAAALKGQGVCLLPLLSVAEDLKTGRLLRLLPDYAAVDTAIQALYLGGRHLSALL
jgi:DNA-binding transcriptional LysR family regulator